jgi:translation initiation factor 6 (eIF-6)
MRICRRRSNECRRLSWRVLGVKVVGTRYTVGMCGDMARLEVKCGEMEVMMDSIFGVLVVVNREGVVLRIGIQGGEMRQ